MSNTRDPGRNSLGWGRTKLGTGAAVPPLTPGHCHQLPGGAFWSPELLTQSLTMALSFHTNLYLGDCHFFPSLPKMSKLLAFLCQPQKLWWGEQGNAWKRTGNSCTAPSGDLQAAFPPGMFLSRTPSCEHHLPVHWVISLPSAGSGKSTRPPDRPSVPSMEPARVCVCCEQPCPLHGPGTGTSQLHSKTMWHWQGYSLGCPPAGASGDTSLEWLQRLSLEWLSPSLPLPEKGIWGQGQGRECRLDPSMAARAGTAPHLESMKDRVSKGQVSGSETQSETWVYSRSMGDRWGFVSRTPRRILLSHLMTRFHFRFPFVPSCWFHFLLYLVSVMSIT